MSLALMSSAGKDCTLALDRARRRGLAVRWFANIYESDTGRVRYHGVRHELVEAQARALGLEPVLYATNPAPFDAVFLQLLQELKRRGCTGVVFGNIHLADVRDWYEQRVVAAGLAHVELLWGEPSIEVAHEVVERGYHGLIVSVNLTMPATRFLGRELDADLLTDLGITDDLDPSGERGEFHTFIYDGPEFRAPVPFGLGATLELDGHRVLDLIPGNGGGG
ncbi:MAG: adenosine nucleotide hydrolase [Gemmatimonadota bacterium]|nr:adenosine nucleotide hydrolase [Gemmatimonadota bacterium]